jgi:demethylmenaquinone methyltransferase/2-methoxy-6-polyprenyl-1,4-benzoquinol methylase
MAGMDKTARVGLVEGIFHGTGDTYDEIAHFATWGRDKRWKEELLQQIHEPRRILDLATGTGILLLEMAERFDCHVTGVELRAEYLDVCRAKAAERDLDVRLIEANAEDFLIDEQFDHITSCYIPKYVNLEKMIPNMVQMLAPGGLFIMQDFAFPKIEWAQKLFFDHFDRMKERCGNLPDWDECWEVLPKVIENTTWIEDTQRIMAEQGLEDIRVVEQSMRMAAMVMGRKPR